MDLLRSLPLGLYLEKPITWLHRLDPRVKLAWLLSFLAAPIMATSVYRIVLVVLLILLTLAAAIPFRVWRQQMGWLLTLSFFVLVLGVFSPDGMGVDHQPRLPTVKDSELLILTDEFKSTATSQASGNKQTPIRLEKFGGNATPLNGGKIRTGEAPETDTATPVASTGGKYAKHWLTRAATTEGTSATHPLNFSQNIQSKIQNSLNPSNYNYVLFEQEILSVTFKITRRSLDLAIRLSTILFTLIYSTNLYLLTTAPEEITAGLESLMLPLRWLKLPVTEIALTLTLSLRFIPLVLEEVQNLIRSVRTRAINWKKLGMKGAVRVWMTVAQRILENLLLRAEQIAASMTVRGFTSPNEHRVQYFSLRLRIRDWLALVTLTVFWATRLVLGTQI